MKSLNDLGERERKERSYTPKIDPGLPGLKITISRRAYLQVHTSCKYDTMRFLTLLVYV